MMILLIMPSNEHPVRGWLNKTTSSILEGASSPGSWSKAVTKLFWHLHHFPVTLKPPSPLTPAATYSQPASLLPNIDYAKHPRVAWTAQNVLDIMFPRTLELAGSVKSLAQGVNKMLTLHGKNTTFFNWALVIVLSKHPHTNHLWRGIKQDQCASVQKTAWTV